MERFNPVFKENTQGKQLFMDNKGLNLGHWLGTVWIMEEKPGEQGRGFSPGFMGNMDYYLY